MDFSGTFELENSTVDDVWLALSDPAMVQHAMPGCEFLVRVDDDDPDFDALREEHADETPELTADPEVIQSRAFEEGGTYAALIEASVGSVSASFESVGTVEEREKPRMRAVGEGSAGNSSFEVSADMELVETDGGVAIEWAAEADVFGRLAQMGQRMINPVANRQVKQFFGSLQDQLEELEERESGEESAESATNDLDDEPVADGAADPERDQPAAAGPDDGPSDSAAIDDAESDPDSGTRSDEEASGGVLARVKRLLGMG